MSGTPSALSFTIVDPMYVVKEMHMQEDVDTVYIKQKKQT